MALASASVKVINAALTGTNCEVCAYLIAAIRKFDGGFALDKVETMND